MTVAGGIQRVEVLQVAREHEFLLRALREVVNCVAAPCHSFSCFSSTRNLHVLQCILPIGLRYIFDLISLIFGEFQPILLFPPKTELKFLGNVIPMLYAEK